MGWPFCAFYLNLCLFNAIWLSVKVCRIAKDVTRPAFKPRVSGVNNYQSFHVCQYHLILEDVEFWRFGFVVAELSSAENNFELFSGSLVSIKSHCLHIEREREREREKWKKRQKREREKKVKKIERDAETSSYGQCDQIWRFIGLWATF